MKQRMLRLLCWTATLVVMLGASLAQAAAEQKVILDARLEGYPTDVTLRSSSGDPSGSTALLYAIVVLLGLLSVGGLFRSAHRTHLD